MGEDLDDIVRDFVVDTSESLVRLDSDLVELEKTPEAADIVTRVFRVVHTIKGVCGFLGYSKLRNICHAGESLLSCIRENRLVFSRDVSTALLAMADAIRQVLTCIEADRSEGAAPYDDVIASLNQLAQQAAPRKVAAPAAAAGKASSPAVISKASPGAHHDQEHLPPAAPAASETAGTWDRGIRVDIDLLDRLMMLVGELVLARNQLLQQNQLQHATVARIDAIATDLQEGVMKTRMQPIGSLWNRFPRLVRDLATACGKNVRVDMQGMDTELDKTLVEAIKDPLTHLIRNSIDHGIETPAVRTTKGKSPEGCISLHASHEGGFVHVTIADDGAGINLEKVRSRAVQNGLITPEQATAFTYKDTINLLFIPGFSTADHVTDLSGRGVGMDVVKSSIERIGGTIEVESRVRLGTKTVVKVPLTLAIIPALMIISCGERYAIPQSSLVELLRFNQKQSRRIEIIGETPVIRLRGSLLPLIDLKTLLGLPAASNADGIVNVVVLQAAQQRFGLVVDAVRDTEEIVVKPLSKQLTSLGWYAGATIMGDGKVALILEVQSLARQAHMNQKAAAPPPTQAPAPTELQAALLFAGKRGPMAMALAGIARLEKFSLKSLEWAGGQHVVQYRGGILHLIALSDVLPDYESESSENGTMDALIFVQNGSSIGLLVGKILDIVDVPLGLEKAGARSGVLGTSVICGRVTEVVDAQVILQAARHNKAETLHG